jgi:hypothetical protein
LAAVSNDAKIAADKILMDDIFIPDELPSPTKKE